VYAFNDPAVKSLTPQEISKMRGEAANTCDWVREIQNQKTTPKAATGPKAAQAKTQAGRNKKQEKLSLKKKKEKMDQEAREKASAKVKTKNAQMLGPSESKLTSLPLPVPVALQSAEAVRVLEKQGVVVIKHRRLSVIMAEQASKAHKEQAFYCFLCCVGILGGVGYLLFMLGLFDAEAPEEVATPPPTPYQDDGLLWAGDVLLWESMRGGSFTAVGGLLRKAGIGSAAGWDSGAHSFNELDLYDSMEQGVRWTMGNGMATYGIGLTQKSVGVSVSVAATQFALICSWNVGGFPEGLHVVESATVRRSLPRCVSGDRLEVSIKGTNVTYHRNGNIVYASTVEPSFPLVVDTIFFGPGAKVEDLELRYYVPPAAGDNKHTAA
jgi:hypothetical protein